MGTITFRLERKKNKRLIVRQNVPYNQRYKSGLNKGKVEKKRFLRYCGGLDTIFVDEQNKITERPEQTTIMFEGLYMKVDEDNIHLLSFMRNSPENKQNGGKLFRELDVEKEELFELDRYNTIDEAKSKVMKAHASTIKGMVLSLVGTSYNKKTDSQLRIFLRTKLENDISEKKNQHSFAEKVIKYLDETETNKSREIISLAISKGIIFIKESVKIVFKEGELIYKGKSPKTLLSDFNNWITTSDEGKETLMILSERLEEIV